LYTANREKLVEIPWVWIKWAQWSEGLSSWRWWTFELHSERKQCVFALVKGNKKSPIFIQMISSKETDLGPNASPWWQFYIKI